MSSFQDDGKALDWEKAEVSQPQAYEDGHGFPQADAEEEARLIRKLDWRLLPQVFLLYSLAVLDRSNLGNARLAGMEDDINLSGNRYNLLGTIFYIACECACASA